MFTISPSLYSADLLNVKQVLDSVKEFEHLHLDLDDGNFVRGISFGMAFIDEVAASTDVPLDAHLEVQNPMDYVDPLAKAGVKTISAHVEALKFPSLFISSVEKNGGNPGLALNIKTPVSFLEPYADQLSQVILVSSEADVRGLSFCRGVLKKISDAKAMLPESVKLWVDGGVNEENLKEIIDAGADAVVMGRAIFAADDPVKTYTRLLELGRTYEKERDQHAI